MGEESGKRMTAQVTWSGRVSVYENVKEGGRWAWKPVGQPGQDTIRRKSKEKGSKAVATAEKFAVINLVDINKGKEIDETKLNQGTADGGGAAAPVARGPPKMTMFEEMAIRRAKKAAQEAAD